MTPLTPEQARRYRAYLVECEAHNRTALNLQDWLARQIETLLEDKHRYDAETLARSYRDHDH